jgi:lantibiotic modifying enzyme
MIDYLTQVPSTGESGSIFERMVAPAVAYAQRELRDRLKPYRSADFAVISSHFELQLTSLLIQTAKRAIDLHFRTFESASYSLSVTRNCTAGNLETVFFENYGERLVAFFRNFPALGRLWSDTISQWTIKVTELTNRAQADRLLIGRTFFSKRDPGPIRSITFNISDPHNRGRETVILHFDCGSVVYKPRSGYNERAWFSLLRWINEQQFFPQFRALRVLCRAHYSWIEHVVPTPCKSLSEIRNYYLRAGGLLCITHLLGAIDCHCDNLIAAGDQPILIDAETLLHPHVSSVGYHGPALLRTGLLPVPKNLDLDAFEVSGLGGTAMGPHTVKVDGRAIPLAAHCEDLEYGFQKMWNALSSQPKVRDGFRRQIRLLERLRWRRVYYPTRKYIEIRDASLEPFALRSGRQRRRVIENLLQRDGVSASIRQRETRSILQLDVPRFTSETAVSFPTPTSFLPVALSWIRSAARSA